MYDASAEGIFAAIVNAFTDPLRTPVNGVHFTKAEFFTKLRIFLADGASVNGVRTGREPILTAKAGKNVMYLLSEAKKQYTDEQLIGVWCAPHRFDLIADSVAQGKKAQEAGKDDPRPLFTAPSNFIEGLARLVTLSGKAAGELKAVNSLFEEEGKLENLSYAPQRWLSYFDPAVNCCGPQQLFRSGPAPI